MTMPPGTSVYKPSRPRLKPTKQLLLLYYIHSPLSIYIYIIYTPNLGLGIAVPGREREQGRFRASTEGARGSREGARGSIEGARGSIIGQCRGAAGGSLKWASFVSA